MKTGPEGNERRWEVWQSLFPVVVGAAFVGWMLVNWTRLGWLAGFHDVVILPVVLKGIYANTILLWSLASAIALAMILWPDGRIWPIVSLTAAVGLLGWLVVYGMARNSPWTSFPLIAILVYVLLRYLWRFVLRVPGLARWLFRELSSYTENNPRCDQYFDAMRAAWIGGDGDQSLWNGEDRRTRPKGRWAKSFTLLRDGLRPVIWIVKLIVWRPIPQRLRHSWLEQILRQYEAEAVWHFRRVQTGATADWDEKWKKLLQATDAISEYTIFGPSHFKLASRESADLDALTVTAARYDRLSRMVLCRMLWYANTIADESGDLPEAVPECWDALLKYRKMALARSVTFRQLYVFGESPAIEEQIDTLTGKSVQGQDAIQRWLLLTSLVLNQQVPDSSFHEVLARLRQQLEGFLDSKTTSSADQVLMVRKALELAFDLREMGWCQMLMATLWYEVPSGDEKLYDVEDAVFDGHSNYRVALRVDTSELQLAAWRAAAVAFSRAGCHEYVDRIKDEVRKRKDLENSRNQRHAAVA